MKNIIKGDKNKLKPVSYRFSFNFLCKKASKNFSFSKTFQIMNQNFFLLAILSSRHLLSQNLFTTQIVRPLTQQVTPGTPSLGGPLLRYRRKTFESFERKKNQHEKYDEKQKNQLEPA